MQKISNDRFSAEIDEHGAQLTHLINKQGGFDYIWNNDIWEKHAPILFPAIGRSNDDAYLINGKKYEMPQHGFVADFDFVVAEKTDSAVSLLLKSSDATKKYYPFDFDFKVSFSLSENGLAVKFDIKNDDDQNLSYSLGYHPAFNVPINGEGIFDDYRLDIEPKTDSLETYEIVKKPNPYRSGKIEQLPNYENGTVKLDHAMFEKGLLIIENTGIKSVKLYSKETKHAVTVDVSDFDHITLWTKEGANAPFLCIEGFNGLPDVYGDLVELGSKEGNHHLDAKATRSYECDIKLD
ncbi:aldose 1-epimerase family protein [Lentilactobacillus diolivorans]|uniref:Aldose 1-epimerase n=2 Tax=Lentilactobacillus diolivorans TaxID=179838 RepID=A0A0R1SF02_9LACO|nr:aldose 1-epimerase family protein [Lentilactobacillus diolivorans]KRL65130.1 aldose 1-epimerase [Lentilactobacillus diolivorans DSM 14421]GEP24930.1 aldose 1-epimerase [Lentilactobacillus diolivorans]